MLPKSQLVELGNYLQKKTPRGPRDVTVFDSTRFEGGCYRSRSSSSSGTTCRKRPREVRGTSPFSTARDSRGDATEVAAHRARELPAEKDPARSEGRHRFRQHAIRGGMLPKSQLIELGNYLQKKTPRGP